MVVCVRCLGGVCVGSHLGICEQFNGCLYTCVCPTW